MSHLTEARTLPLSGSMSTPLVWLIVLMSAPLVIGVIAAAFAYPKLASSPTVKQLPVVVFLVPVLLLLVLAFLARSLMRAGVRIDAGMLVVNTGLGSKRFALSSLHSGGLHIVDLNERTELKPFLRQGGIGLPGFCGGWFRLRNGERAICLLLQRDRVCYLRSDDGTSLLLSLQHPETLRVLLAAH